MHLSGWPVKTSAATATTTLLAPTSCTALGTATRFIGKSPGSEELLLADGESKIIPAFHAGDGLV